MPRTAKPQRGPWRRFTLKLFWALLSGSGLRPFIYALRLGLFVLVDRAFLSSASLGRATDCPVQCASWRTTHKRMRRLIGTTGFSTRGYRLRSRFLDFCLTGLKRRLRKPEILISWVAFAQLQQDRFLLYPGDRRLCSKQHPDPAWQSCCIDGDDGHCIGRSVPARE